MTTLTRVSNLIGMAPETLLPSSPFADVKARLSEVMNDVVHHHHPHLVGRHGGREQMLLLGLPEIDAVLEPFCLAPQVSVSDGEFVIRLGELNLIAGGATYDEALEELIELVGEYSEDFFERLGFYMQTDRRQHLPYLLRFALTPPERRTDLLCAAPRGSEDRAPAAT